MNYYVILHTLQFLLDLVAERDIGTLYIDGLNFCPSIWTASFNRSLDLPYHTFSGLRTNYSTPGGRMKTKSFLLVQGTKFNPPPICAQWVDNSVSQSSGCVLLVVVLKTFVAVVNTC